ncbi:phospholipid carrier-dependent glycosyltransferase [Sphingomonas sp. CFBP 13720]|uniref:phospholipid carrier-dependent glycosyltransferase n=1 Tax=Sphingomonas sp. CFBP 13720 TaxID=2775302 RepID=UPI00177C2F01|nr:phospholipid carrier-dependent glycosyltransferase [Sphingomonas sp. CFBP 13720]MBD8678751.1 phospholipid carrier-dependent glycosyltransferase [Sphingomonas sp. CFBP 13720]
MLSRLRDRPWTTAALIAVAAQLLFAWGLGRPGTLSFDEVHYVPAARTLLSLAHPANTEHPLVAKELIAIGIALFGDDPWGWRIMGTLAATATVLGVFACLQLLFRRTHVSAFGAAMAVLNQTLFVQARTAMLDVYLGAFVTLAVAALLWSMRGEWPKARMALAAILFGLAVGVKWAAAPYVAGAGVLILWGRRRGYWPGAGTIALLAILFGVSIATYFATFAPAFFYAQDPLTLARLLPFQWEMYQRQTQVLPAHPYQSAWWTWPLLIRPMWYFYQPDEGVQRGVLLIGNPAIMWAGLLAVGACLWTGMRRRVPALVGVGLLWVGSVAVWAVIPKSLGFYYYYHLSGIWLCIALAAAFHAHARGRWRHADEWFAIPAIALFVYFHPILSAAPLDGPQSFNRWMWFGSWR